MLILDHLHLQQGSFDLHADLSIPDGARVAVIGPSGEGKSTLLSAIAGFLDPTEGRILWNSTDLAGQAPGTRPISMLFQDNNLFPHLSVAQNISLAVRPDLKLSADQRGQVSAALAQVGLDGFGDKAPGTLSGGQAARAALARVLLRARPLLLLDEPFAALGPGLKSEMLALVQELAGKSTVLMVSHDPEDAKRFADLTVLVADGVVTAPMPTETLFANPPEALRSYLA